jgi:ribosomal protein S12 methylthiotransferase accessory factor
VASDEAALVALTKTLSAAGIEVYSVDLTRRRFGVPVARLLAPKLQPYPSPVVTGRLAATVAATGGSDPYTREVPLM